MIPNGPGSLTPGPCTYTVAAPSGALAGPSFSSVTRMTCSGRCAVPTNRSVDSTPAIRIFSSWHTRRPSGHTPRSRRVKDPAAAAGSSASVMARTTTTRVAPASSTASSRPRLMPPIANQGRAGAQKGPRARHREVVLAQMLHVGAGREGHVGPVVYRQQAPVPPARVGEHLQQPEFLPGLQSLLAQ